MQSVQTQLEVTIVIAPQASWVMATQMDLPVLVSS
jgi:hypothetical protein